MFVTLRLTKVRCENLAQSLFDKQILRHSLEDADKDDAVNEGEDKA
jgi:hypothetical protein